MSIRQNLIRARSHFAFIFGLSFAAVLSLYLDKTFISAPIYSTQSSPIKNSPDQTVLAPPQKLTERDITHAKIAWHYFEQNTDPKTGLVNSVHGFPSTTVWDQASYLLGLISAYKIGIISQEVFDARMSKVLNTLSDIPLFFGKLPNKVYDTRTLAMTTYTNAPTKTGIGWSALDVARITVPLNIMLYEYPQHAQAAGKILTRWDFGAMLKNGVMLGARLHKETGLPETVQEGRLGYEEYGARAIGLLGLDALTAAKYDDFLKFESVAGQEVATDSRQFKIYDAPNYVVSEPYILMAIEFGLDHEAQELAHRLYKTQESRWRTSGQLTAVSEDHVDQSPYFIYNTVFANGTAWNAVSEDGTSYPDLRTISTKAVFGWHALYATDYTHRLMAEILRTQTKEYGWFSGLYEKDNRLNAVATANTNGILLEIINYKANGPLLSGRFKKGD